MSLLSSAALALTLAVGAPQDAPAPQSGPAAQVDDVVVIGQPLRDMVESFVDEITTPPRGRRVARWDRKVCVGVANLRRDAAQLMIDRVSQVALDIGLEIGEPGCSPNILIIGAEDASALADALIEMRPYAFRPPYGGAAGSKLRLEQFRTSEAAVRWWHVALPVEADGGGVAVRIPGYGPPLIANRSAGRLTSPIRNDLRRAFIIVDVERAEGVSFQQLSDYVAMVAFAQIDPDPEVAGFDTVLNLFNDPAGVDGMSDWDLSYLQALYAVELNQRNPQGQLGAVGSSMTRDRASAQNQAQTEDR